MSLGALMIPIPSEEKYFCIYMYCVFSSVKSELNGFILP